jgi:hypothetical protein
LHKKDAERFANTHPKIVKIKVYNRIWNKTWFYF